jgi:glutathione S-transferase
MSLSLYAHPFSSYCQKVLMALYENATPFALKLLGPETPDNFVALKQLSPLGKFPLLDDNGAVVFEATSIIGHLALHHGGPVRLIPDDPKAALDVRMLDRVFDNYVMTPMQRIVSDHMRPADKRDRPTVTEAHALLDTTYGWLNGRLAGHAWAAG